MLIPFQTSNEQSDAIYTFFLGLRENAFTHAVWDSAEPIPTKLKIPLFLRQEMTP